jgi:molybdenum cofactor cytidylyltransferase
VLVLAAGSSSRLGRPKQLIEFRGKTLLRHAVQTALSLECGPVAIVLGAGCTEIEPCLEGLDGLVVENANWREGMGSSIRQGLSRLIDSFPGIDGVLIMLCDQPMVSADSLRALLQGQSPISAASYENTLGVPAWFDRSLFPELLALPGAEGAKAILRRHQASVFAVRIPEAGIDIDTASDAAWLVGPED